MRIQNFTLTNSPGETTRETKMKEVIDKIRNYYNTCCDIDGRPPYKVDFNEFLHSLEKNL